MQAPEGNPDTQKPRLRSFTAGQLLCAFGDPPGPLFVVIKGKLLVYRPDPGHPSTNEPLAQLGPGAIVGELAPMLRQPRTASVGALVETTVLEVPVDHVGSLTRQHAPFIRVIVDALQERAGLSMDEIRAVIGKWGVEVADLDDLATLEDDLPSEAEPSAGLLPHDPAAFYTKTIACPVCQQPFPARVVRFQSDQPVQRETDFHQVYMSAFNPSDYELWVCPVDLYAALPMDFGPLAFSQREPMIAGIDEFVQREWGGQRPDFAVDRSLELREQTLSLALAACRLRGAGPSRTAALLHRMAWCARERDDTEAERAWLAEALAAYRSAHAEADMDSEKDDLRIQYLCGELALRLGDRHEAYRWFGHALMHPAIGKHAMWERMIRDQMGEAVALAKAPHVAKVDA
jgi:uncharacterized protein (DUF2225 family)